MRHRLIRFLLFLYPGAWHSRYGREFEALLEDEPLGARVLLDVTNHCLRQWFSPEAPTERARFRFPRAIVFLMTVAFGGVVTAIRIASRTAGDTSGSASTTLGSILLFMLLTMCAAAAIVQGVLRCLRRSGLHRLENIQTRICSEESRRYE
jgi:hypothetical protein